MAKKPMLRVTEPDENLVHYMADDLSGNVTLCGLTDFLGHKEHGQPTNAPLTCNACKSIKAYCNKFAD